MKKVGNYVLLSELGKGQFGVVSKAQHNDTKEIFAIKVISKFSYRNDTEFAELVIAEMKSMSNIKHPNFIHCYEFIETNYCFYSAEVALIVPA